MEFQCRGWPKRFEFSAYTKAQLTQFLTENPGIRLKITPELPESRKLRRFYHGAVLPLWAYLDCKDYRDSAVLEDMHEVAKLEFNAGSVVINGTVHKIGRSTKGREALTPFVERVIDWLIENYEPPKEALDPESFKRWRDEIFPHGGAETYIGYLEELGILRQQHGTN